MKKALILGLVLTLCLAVVGVGYGAWIDQLDIDGTVNTGDLDVQFVGDPISNDDGYVGFPPKDLDDDGRDPTENQTAGIACARLPDDVGFTSAVIMDPGLNPAMGLLAVTLDTVYPSYLVTVWFDIHNLGSIPAVVSAMTVNGTDIVECVPVPLDLSGDGLPDITVHITNLDVGQVLVPCEPVQVDLHIHVLQDAPQGEALSFALQIDFTNWNE